MRAMVACMWLAACWPGLAKAPPRFAEDALAGTSGDAGATEKLLRGSVMNGGLWFADASCASFATAGPVKPEQFHDFARCIAGLRVEASNRRDPLPDVSILRYAPGIEIEARVIDDGGGPRLTWIGFESRRDDADSLPTMSPALLESLRVEGTPSPLVADPNAYAWIKLCLSDDGSLASVTPFEASSLQAARELGSATATWKFKPGPVGAACSMVFLGNSPAKDRLPYPLPPGSDRPMIGIRGLQRISGEKNIVPDDDTKRAIGRAHVHRVFGSFKVCVDIRGHVSDVVPLRPTGVAAYDQKILSVIKNTWTYEPFHDNAGPVPICTGVTFTYTQT